ncbi:cell division protein FtsB [Endothiovibrio diazotrophicus]
MKYLVAILVPLLLMLQYALWFGDGGVLELWRLKQSIQAQVAENEKLHERNAALAGEVRDLKQGLDALEERARSEMGMIGKDETFYQIVDETRATGQ